MLALTVLACPGESGAIDMFNLIDRSTPQCPDGVVRIENSVQEVLDRCGKPLSIKWVQNVGTVWIYHFEGGRYMYYFAFLHRKLQRVVSAPCNPADPECVTPRH